jgi:hypothetical protein
MLSNQLLFLNMSLSLTPSLLLGVAYEDGRVFMNITPALGEGPLY